MIKLMRTELIRELELMRDIELIRDIINKE